MPAFGGIKSWLFLVRLESGATLGLEVKGFVSEQDDAKFQAAKRWVSAVNNWHGQVGIPRRERSQHDRKRNCVHQQGRRKPHRNDGCDVEQQTIASR
jgi:hypothetical protein